MRRSLVPPGKPDAAPYNPAIVPRPRAMHHALETVLILLAAAVAVVTLCRRAQLPAMLGYLLVGIAIGPHALGLIASRAKPKGWPNTAWCS
ncbi:cation:proton antiporter [Chitinimonas koreensis]|uniref:cation:proton antiporter n=1 Tax=Chitinimonas koreensis TaxID=356302 RepID=UPI0027E57DD0|nr:cation:proton antiporter [Chitinimonas koreensis]